MKKNITQVKKLLEKYISQHCVKISFAAMENCGESFKPNGYNSYHETTWGTVFDFENRKPLVITWGENSSIGDPFYTNVIDYDSFIQIDTIQLQDVSKLQPWSRYIKSKLVTVDILTYETNYPNEKDTGWHRVLWAIELEFTFGPIFIGALHHGDFENYTIAADEIVTICDPVLIENVKSSRKNQRR